MEKVLLKTDAVESRARSVEEEEEEAVSVLGPRIYLRSVIRVGVQLT